METADMGRVLTDVTVYNLGDLFEVKRGRLPADQVRKVEVRDALVDSGATTLCLPKRLLDQLGVTPAYQQRAMTAAGERVTTMYDSVRAEIQGRIATVDPAGLPDECPVLVGQLVLEAMDWAIDMKRHRLIGNPAHGGEQMLEMWSFFPPAAG